MKSVSKQIQKQIYNDTWIFMCDKVVGQVIYRVRAPISNQVFIIQIKIISSLDSHFQL